ARPFAPLLVCQWVFVFEQLLSLQIWKLLITFVPEKQGFAAVADEYECVVRDFQFVHVFAPRPVRRLVISLATTPNITIDENQIVRTNQASHCESLGWSNSAELAYPVQHAIEQCPPLRQSACARAAPSRPTFQSACGTRLRRRNG